MMSPDSLANTRVLLIGSTEFPKDPTIPNVPNIANNINLLKECLVDPEIVGIPEANIKVSLNDTCEVVLDKLKEIADQTRKEKFTLIIYFAGHAMFSTDDGKYYLLTNSSKSNHLKNQSIPRDDFRDYINRSLAGVKFVIMDSCHSGAMIDKLSPAQSMLQVGIDDFKGTYFMASSARKEFSRFRKERPDLPTFFTGKFIDILLHGIETDKEFLTLEDIFAEIETDFSSKKLPVPLRSSFKKGQNVSFARNKFSRQKRMSVSVQFKHKGIFLMYAWADKKYADLIHDRLSAGGYYLRRHTSDFRADLSSHDISDKIQGYNLILLLISEEFLKSDYCVFEAMELLKNQKVKIVLVRYNAKGAGRDYRKSTYRDYWQKKLTESRAIDEDKEAKAVSAKIYHEILENLDQLIINLDGRPRIEFDPELQKLENDIALFLPSEIVEQAPEVAAENERNNLISFIKKSPVILISFVFVLITLIFVFIKFNAVPDSRQANIYLVDAKTNVGVRGVVIELIKGAKLVKIATADDGSAKFTGWEKGKYRYHFVAKDSAFNGDLYLNNDTVVRFQIEPKKGVDTSKLVSLFSNKSRTTYPQQWVQPKYSIDFEDAAIKVELIKFDVRHTAVYVDVRHIVNDTISEPIATKVKIPQYEDLSFSYGNQSFILHLDSIRNGGDDKVPTAYFHLSKTPGAMVKGGI